MNRVLNRTKMLAAWIRKGVATTKVRYILSYLVVYLMLIIGFQFIMEQYFAELYLKQILRQTENQLEIWNEGIDSNLVYLMQMNNALEMNINVLMARYELKSQNDYQTGMELQKYDQASKLVTSIVYKTSDKLLSTMLPITCEDNVFCFHDRGEIYFDLKPYLDSERAQLIYIGTEQAGELIYLPATDSRKNYVLMYVLDKEELLGSLEKTGLFPSTETVFLDNRKNIIMATGDGEQHLDLAEFALEEGTFSVRDFKYVCVEISQGDLYAVVVITDDALMQEVRTLFVGAYCMLVLLGLAGVLVICFSMKFTYGSLEVFAQKFLQDQDSKEDYFKQLDQVFTTKMEESIQMGEKLEKYRTGVQKSLLDSLMADSDRVDLDRLFEVDEVQIFLLGVQVSEAMDSSAIEAQLQLLLPAGYEIFMLKAEEQELLYLLNCKQDIFEEEIEEKAKRMEHMLEKMNEAYGNVFFLSSGSDSPLDILEMYREIKTKMIIEKEELDKGESVQAEWNCQYPYEKLDELSNCLYEYDFAAVRSLFEQILQEIREMHMESEELGNFFVRSILIDVITTLGNAMNQAHIKFDTFSEVYYETIYLCRSCSYHENETLINANIEKLLTVYEESANDISIGRIEKIIQDSFENPDFSITDLANTFHVSAAYMSFLFKKEKNVGFAEYLWKLRLNKAQKLLTDTDMSIESVSAAVGYLNVSSFRRKFKQDMGVTPLQYRNGSDS